MRLLSVTAVPIRDWERDAVEFLSRKRVDGIISMPVDAEGNHLKKIPENRKAHCTH